MNLDQSRMEIVCSLTLLASCLRRDLFAGLAADIDKIDEDLHLLKHQKAKIWVTYKLGPFESEFEFIEASGCLKYW